MEHTAKIRAFVEEERKEAKIHHEFFFVAFLKYYLCRKSGTSFSLPPSI